MLITSTLLLIALAQQAPAPPQAAMPAATETPLAAAPHASLRTLLGELKADVEHLPSLENLSIAAVGGGLAAAVHPADRSVNTRLVSRDDVVNDLFAPARYFGDTPEQLALSVGTYVFGRVMHQPRVSHLGMDLLRAQAVTELLVGPLKLATERARPDGSDHFSFPSSHAALTFAAAAVIERHLGWKKSLLAYVVASYVATSRLRDNRHYLSDVVFGAAVGLLAGRTVTRHGRTQWTVGPTAVSSGVAITAARTNF